MEGNVESICGEGDDMVVVVGKCAYNHARVKWIWGPMAETKPPRPRFMCALETVLVEVSEERQMKWW